MVRIMNKQFYVLCEFLCSASLFSLRKWGYVQSQQEKLFWKHLNLTHFFVNVHIYLESILGDENDTVT